MISFNEKHMYVHTRIENPCIFHQTSIESIVTRALETDTFNQPPKFFSSTKANRLKLISRTRQPKTKPTSSLVLQHYMQNSLVTLADSHRGRAFLPQLARLSTSIAAAAHTALACNAKIKKKTAKYTTTGPSMPCEWRGKNARAFGGG